MTVQNITLSGSDDTLLRNGIDRTMVWSLPELIRPGFDTDAGMRLHNVLLAEDNMIDQLGIRRLLEKQGCSVTCVATGQDAVDQFDRERFDVVFMDILMPDIDGFEATRLIREKEQASEGQVPIIALTAYSLSAVRDKCMSVGMNGYLSKPVAVRDLEMLFSEMQVLRVAQSESIVG